MIAAFTPDEALAYERAMFTERDRINSLRDTYDVGRKEGLATGRAEGRAEGEANAKTEIAKTMKIEGFPVAVIAKYTGLTPEQITAL